MYILGISAYFHDSSAVLIQDGHILCAAQEERFSRKKHDESFPKQSILFCLDFAKIKLSEVDGIVFFEKPLRKFERILDTFIAEVPKGFPFFYKVAPIWFQKKLFTSNLLIKELNKIEKSNFQNKLLFSEHHLSHAASAFFPSQFQEAAVITIDGVGEQATTCIFKGKDNQLVKLYEQKYPHSVGLLYSAFTYYCGFKVNSGEYKLMGLAPFGKPLYKDLIKQNLVEIFDDGSIKLNMKYFTYGKKLRMFGTQFVKLFGQPARLSDAVMSQFYMDIAASIQEVVEDICERIWRFARKITECENVCIAGGVGLNCVVNGKLASKKIYNNVFVQPASGDAGTALGAALAVWHVHMNNPRHIYYNPMNSGFLGPEQSEVEIERNLIQLNANFSKINMTEFYSLVAQWIEKGKVVGWHQGRMEFGPRALGARSILANPLLPDMQKVVNSKIKFRESFRPFAPIVLANKMLDYFECAVKDEYMLFTGKSRNPELLPSITHVDGSARIQAINENHPMYSLLIEFEKLTGVPVLINTSFNVRGEPMVCNVSDAYKCFMGTDMDVLAIPPFLLFKEQQPASKLKKYLHEVEKD